MMLEDIGSSDRTASGAAGAVTIPSKPLQRVCGACQHKNGDQCRHPQSPGLWGRLRGMERYLSDSNVKFPIVEETTKGCGWWRP
jgi:hypothetical protein